MKTIKILFAFLPHFLVLPSRSYKDDEPVDNNSQLISQLQGKWKLDGARVSEGDIESNPTGQDVIYEFRPGGIIKITGDFFDDFDKDDEFYRGSYTVNNNIVNIKIDGETLPHAIHQISETTLRFAAPRDADDKGLKDVILHFTKIAD